MALPAPLPRPDLDPDPDANPDANPDERRAVLAALAERVRPVSLAVDRTLPVAGPLGAVLAGLGRGTVVALNGSGATSMALGLVGGAASDHIWTVVVGLADLAPVALVDAGLDPTRVALVDPGTSGRHVEAIAAVLGAVDLVLVDARLPLRPTDARRLTARARERGTVLVVLAPGADPTRWRDRPAASVWPADVVVSVRAEPWWGAEAGHGHLRGRMLEVHVTGRGRAARGDRHRVAFPDPDGSVRVLDHDVIDRLDDPGGDAMVLPFAR